MGMLEPFGFTFRFSFSSTSGCPPKWKKSAFQQMLSEACHFAESDLLTKFGTHQDICPVLEQVVWPHCTSLKFSQVFWNKK